MAFRMHHTVILECSIEEAWQLFSSPELLPTLQHALPSCRDCVVTSFNNDTPPILNQAKYRQLLDLPSLPTDIPWPSLDKDAKATHFTFHLPLANVQGTQVVSDPKSAHVVLFHSHVKSAGIEEHKLRVLESVSVTQTRVKETIWGKAPWWLARMLSISGMAAKTHKAHMEAYGTLLRSGQEAETKHER